MKNLLFIIFCTVSLFLAIFFYQKYTNTQQALELANRRVLDRDTEIYRLQKKLSSTGNSVSVNSMPTQANKTYLGRLNATDINRLKAKGIQNPEAEIKDSLLKNQKSLIVSKGVLGGEMAIREIQILSDHYVLAYFEDGHNGGYLILRYDLSTGGNIAWKVLDSYSI